MKMETLRYYAVFVLAGLLLINIVGLIGLNAGFSTSGAASDGAVDLTLIVKDDCVDCFDASQYQPELERIGVTFDNVKQLDADSRAAKKLIRTYDIERLPALIFSEELGGFPVVAEAWDRVGSIAKDGSYILAGSNPPFYDLEDEKIRGLISITYLTDASCDQCYDVTLHKQILSRIGIEVSEEKSVDVSSQEGAALVEAYGITAVPTIILDGEAGLYPGFAEVWSSVGKSFEEENVHVFTNVEALGMTYKDLSTGQLVAPEAS